MYIVVSSMSQIDLRFIWIPPQFTFFLSTHDVCGESYAATAYSAPTNAIASSKVKLEISLPFIVAIGV